MKLHHYLESKNEPGAHFARRVGADQSVISRLVTGDRTPTLALAQRIDKATGGQVSLHDWEEIETNHQKPS